MCLGLKSKKEDEKELLTTNEIDILCLQEVEIEGGYDTTILVVFINLVFLSFLLRCVSINEFESQSLFDFFLFNYVILYPLTTRD